MATKAKATTSKPATTAKRSRAKAKPVAAEAPVATAVAERPSLQQTIVLGEVFGIDGQVNNRDTFKYNKVLGGSYLIRLAIFKRLATAAKDEIMALTLNQRKAAFALVKGERQRYYGEAVRKIDSPHGKKGEPLPKLSFESPIAAVAYGTAVRDAGANLRRCVFGDTPAAPQPSPSDA